MATTEKISYGTAAAVTITLASLASSSTRLVGRESTSISNATTLASDYAVTGKITLGTSPTVSKTVELWVVARDDGAGAWPDVFDGTDSDETITSENVKNSFCRLVWSATTDATTNLVLPISGSVAAALGYVPKDFAFFVTHDSGVALNSTGSNHAIYVQPIFYQGV